MPDFMHGLELNRIFYQEAVRPILDREFPALQYSTALIGIGSEVLGFDIHTELDAIDWLTIPQEKLRTVTAGAVYHDGIGLEAVRERFSYYPTDV